MSATLESYGRWLADYYLLASVLLALALAGMAALKQPAQRLAIAKSTLVSLVLLAIVCAIPGWSAVHLLTAKSPPPVLETPPTLPAPPAPPMVEQPLRTAVAPPIMPKAEAPAPTAIAAAPRPPVKHPISWPAILVTAHLAGAIGILSWLLLGWLAALRLRRTAIAAPPTVVDILTKLVATNYDLPSRVDLLTHPRLDVPVALGVRRPAIVLPAHFIESAIRNPKSEIAAVLAHESAHILNHDLRWLALARCLLIGLWANPLFWFARRRLRLDQEALADAAAAEVTSRQHYAEQLVAWARHISARPALHLSSAVGLWEGPSQLRERIALLLNERLTITRHCSRLVRLLTFGAGLALAIALSLITLKLAEPTPAAAAEKPTEKSDDAKPTAKKPPEMDTLEVQLLDGNGSPIKGAKVKPYGMRSGNDGSHYGWFADQQPWGAPKETMTDDQGIATVRYPRFVMEDRAVSKVSVQLSHPDFVAASHDIPVGDTPSKVIMAQGGVVEIHVDSGGQAKIEELFAGGGENSSAQAWTRTKDGSLRSPHLAAGAQSVRAVWLPKNKPAQFTGIANVQVNEGEIRQISVQLQPVLRFAGRLEEAVPRPIVKGIVQVAVDSPGRHQWHDWTAINEDGSFEFESLPPDGVDAQILAYCDGYISAAGSDGDGNRLTPQKAKLAAGATEYVVDMEPTSTAVAKLIGPDGKPAQGVKVYFFPNIFWSFGSNVVRGAQYRTRDALADPDFISRFWSRRKDDLYHAVSDENGIARVGELPAYPYQMMNIEDDRFQLPIGQGLGRNRYFVFSKLAPGETSEETITLEPKNPAAENADSKPAKEKADKGQGRLDSPRPVPAVFAAEQVTEKKNAAPGILGYGDGKPDGKKSLGGSGEMIRFELPEGVTKIKGIRIHGSRYGYPQAPKEDFEITFLNDNRDETLHVEAAPYRLFNRGKEQWVRIPFKSEIELPRKFWVCLNFNAERTKGVYVSYDTSTKGEYSRTGLPGDKEPPKETDFKGDWMVQLILSPAKQ